jgi:hypothetical protein
LLARFAGGASRELWPWRDAASQALPGSSQQVAPELAGLAFFVLLARMASERRARGGPAGGLSIPFEQAGFGAGEWLPDRTDDLALRLLAASAPEPPDARQLDALGLLLRATLAREAAPRALARGLQELGVDLAEADAPALLERARATLPELLRWLEENGRELLERDS